MIWEGEPAKRFPAYIGVELDPAAKVCRVQGVTPEAPAAQAGLRVNDVVLSFNGAKVANDNELVRLVSLEIPGTEVTLQVRRGEATIALRVMIGKRPW